MREHYREKARKLKDQSLDYTLSQKEVDFIKELRKERNNERIYYSVQDRNLAVEEVDGEKILFHDLKHNKIYRSGWHDDIGMPIIAYYKNTSNIIYLSSLVEI